MGRTTTTTDVRVRDLTYQGALALSNKGYRIRRAKLWDTWLARQDDGNLHWQFRDAKVRKEFPKTVFSPGPFDAQATDWEAVKS